MILLLFNYMIEISIFHSWSYRLCCAERAWDRSFDMIMLIRTASLILFQLSDIAWDDTKRLGKKIRFLRLDQDFWNTRMKIQFGFFGGVGSKYSALVEVTSCMFQLLPDYSTSLKVCPSIVITRRAGSSFVIVLTPAFGGTSSSLVYHDGALERRSRYMPWYSLRIDPLKSSK